MAGKSMIRGSRPGMGLVRRIHWLSGSSENSEAAASCAYCLLPRSARDAVAGASAEEEDKEETDVGRRSGTWGVSKRLRASRVSAMPIRESGMSRICAAIRLIRSATRRLSMRPERDPFCADRRNGTRRYGRP
jgi:hypothetical protein